MARTYHVKRAQQRYATKPVIDPATGEQKLSPKMRRGVQMTSKTGRLVFMKVTERDLTKPLPMPKCSKCGVEIKVGEPYKYTETYNRTIIRCGPCPTPQPWEYSSSLSARLAEIQYNAEATISGVTDQDSAESARDEIEQAVRELAEEKGESADNMESGFGHETEQSNELRDISEQLESWADDIGSVDIPEYPEADEEECPECGGTGDVDEDDPNPELEGAQVPCEECGGTGQTTAEEPSEDQVDEWLEAVREALSEKVGECPL